jgi:hypothetical protein
MLNREDYDLLDEVRKANGWSVGDATRRAIHALSALDDHMKAIAEQQEGQIARVLQRLRRDVDPALLLRTKPMSRIETEDGNLGIRIDDLQFFEEDDRLFARREIGGRVEVWEAQDGKLVLRHQGAPTPDQVALN